MSLDNYKSKKRRNTSTVLSIYGISHLLSSPSLHKVLRQSKSISGQSVFPFVLHSDGLQVSALSRGNIGSPLISILNLINLISIYGHTFSHIFPSTLHFSITLNLIIYYILLRFDTDYKSSTTNKRVITLIYK